MLDLRARSPGQWIPPRVVDAVVVVVLAGLVALGTAIDPAVTRPYPVALAIQLVVVAPLWWRRRAPVGVLIAVLALAIPSRLLLGTDGADELALVVAVYTVASTRPPGYALAGVAADALLLTITTLAGDAPDTLPGSLTGQVVGQLIVVLLGMYVRTRRAYVAGLRARADQAERERELEARAAVADERRRIARELHDVVAHHVSVITLHAGALEASLPPDAGSARESAGAIRETSREALTELRRMLGVLRSDDADASDGPRDPQPDLSRLEELAARMRDAGLDVRLQLDGTDRRVPASVALATYRIVQEALTNTLRHAGTVPVDVTVRVEEDAVAVRVVDEGRPGPPRHPEGTRHRGHGIEGMRERVAVFGGDLSAGRRDDGGFEVRARLPIAATHR